MRHIKGRKKENKGRVQSGSLVLFLTFNFCNITKAMPGIKSKTMERLTEYRIQRKVLQRTSSFFLHGKK